MNIQEFLSESRLRINTLLSERDTKTDLFNKQKERIRLIDSKLKTLSEVKMAIESEIDAIRIALKTDIDNLTTIAINIVYDRDLSFELKFIRKENGSSEYIPCIIESEEEFDPKTEQCGGILDVISYALRIILKSFEVEKTRNFFFFDEPLKFLGGGILAEKAADMMKQINTDLGIQSVIISHDESCIITADKQYEVTHNKQRSFVRLVSESTPILPNKEIKRIKSNN